MERVTTANAYSSVIGNLLQAENNQYQADQEISSGKVATDLKGFGANAEALTAAQSMQTRVNGYVQTATNVASQLTAQATALGEVSGAGQSARQAVAQAIASGSADGLMSSLQSAFSQAVDGLNTQYNGSYLFSGGNVTTPAVSVQSTQTMSATFQNDQNAGTAQLNETTKVPIGQLASGVGGALFSALSAVQALNAGTPLSGPLTSAQMTALTNLLHSFDSANSGLTQAVAQNGLVQNQVDAIKNTQIQRQTDLTTTIGDMANADMGKASSQLAQAQTALQASAKVFQTLQSTSLLNYLPNG